MYKKYFGLIDLNAIKRVKVSIQRKTIINITFGDGKFLLKKSDINRRTSNQFRQNISILWIHDRTECEKSTLMVIIIWNCILSTLIAFVWIFRWTDEMILKLSFVICFDARIHILHSVAACTPCDRSYAQDKFYHPLK